MRLIPSIHCESVNIFPGLGAVLNKKGRSNIDLNKWTDHVGLYPSVLSTRVPLSDPCIPCNAGQSQVV